MKGSLPECKTCFYHQRVGKGPKHECFNLNAYIKDNVCESHEDKSFMN
jgi:hypothetical protein